MLIEEEKYLLGLVRCIRHNPLKAGIAETMDGYPWSSHHGYDSNSVKWDWLYKGPVDSCFSTDLGVRKRKYLQYMSREDTEEIGSEAFIQKIKGRYSYEKIHNERGRALGPKVPT